MAVCCFGSAARIRSVKRARWRSCRNIRDVTFTCMLCQFRCSASIRMAAARVERRSAAVIAAFPYCAVIHAAFDRAGVYFDENGCVCRRSGDRSAAGEKTEIEKLTIDCKTSRAT